MTADDSDWADLGDQLAQSEQASTEPTNDGSDESSTSDATTDGSIDGTDESNEDVNVDRTIEDAFETPAFEYDECEQSGLHPREEQWQTYETARALAGATLAKHEITGVKKREFDDAALRLAKKYPEELAQLVIEARGIDPDEMQD